jgi:hypothetical protein
LGGELSIGIVSLISNLIIRYHFNRILFLHIQGQAAISTPAPLFMLGNYGTQMLRYSLFQITNSLEGSLPLFLWTLQMFGNLPTSTNSGEV